MKRAKATPAKKSKTAVREKRARRAPFKLALVSIVSEHATQEDVETAMAAHRKLRLGEKLIAFRESTA